MANVCINTIDAEGTSSQIDQLIEKLSETFGVDLDINDNFGDDAKSYASLQVNSKWEMPRDKFRDIINALSDSQGLYIRIISEEPGEEYFEQSIFTDGQWSFDNQPTINEQIFALKEEGIQVIRRLLQEKGNIKVKEDVFCPTLYLGDDGYGTSGMILNVELDAKGILSVYLDDETTLSEYELITGNVMDILSLIHEDHVTYHKQ